MYVETLRPDLLSSPCAEPPGGEPAIGGGACGREASPAAAEMLPDAVLVVRLAVIALSNPLMLVLPSKPRPRDTAS